MSSTQSSSTLSRHGSHDNNCVDPLDTFVDFSNYEQVSFKQSPSVSPAHSKGPFARPSISSTGSLMPSPQTLSGPSHPYGMHKQQTGIPAGGIANTLAINNQLFGGYGYSSGLSPADEFLDFNTAPAQTLDGLYNLDMDFEASADSDAFFYPEQNVSASQEFVNPSVIGVQENATPAAAPTITVGRVWPGMHQQQAALAKAQQQQKQQQLLIQQQRQNSAPQQPKQQRKSNPPTDPIVEEKISQLLHSMRQNSEASLEDDDDSSPNGMGSRSRKDEEDMDEDERLLASEEGKKLSSKERRQLRNKVSARAFRSRRKEYIGQLEGEIAGKVNENSQLRAENKALLEENKRLSDLTRMLLSSPSFSGFLDNLSSNPTAGVVPQVQLTPAPKIEQQPTEARQVRKDVNPYAAQQQMANQQINFTMMPEQPLDFSMLDMGNTDFMYQPQVFAVTALPEITIDTSVLSGKTTNLVGESLVAPSEDAKIELPTIERAAVIEISVTAAPAPADDEFDADPAFALYAESPASAPVTAPSTEDLVARLIESIVPEKASPHFELVVAGAEVDDSATALARVSRLCVGLDAVMTRLEEMTADV